jgi:serine/threonine protein kinase
MADFQIGETIGDYQIISVLGKGGMGKVFCVHNLITDRIEAMKVVLPDLEAKAGLAERFLREIKVHASLDHPNIARLRTALRIENRLVMILELVEGVGLNEMLSKGPLPLNRAIGYIDQVLAGLSCAHAFNVVHRDLKPANIMITPDGRVKITDFGVAQAESAPRLTQTGSALGSLCYMSPEQTRNATVDARSDLYSVGVTFFEMLTGHPPFDGESAYAIMRAHVEEIPILPPDLPVAVASILRKSLAKDPAHRFQSAAEFQAALRTGHAPEPLHPTTTIAFPVTQLTSAPIEPSRLARVEQHLTRSVGPIARHLLSRAVKQSTTLPELCQTLAGQIQGKRERDDFLRACELDLGSFAPGSSTPLPAAPAATPVPSRVWEPEILQAAKRSLATYMGPIAARIVDRAAKKAHTPEELYQTLAAEIPAPRDRQAFLDSMSRR